MDDFTYANMNVMDYDDNSVYFTLKDETKDLELSDIMDMIKMLNNDENYIVRPLEVIYKNGKYDESIKKIIYQFIFKMEGFAIHDKAIQTNCTFPVYILNETFKADIANIRYYTTRAETKMNYTDFCDFISQNANRKSAERDEEIKSMHDEIMLIEKNNTKITKLISKKYKNAINKLKSDMTQLTKDKLEFFNKDDIIVLDQIKGFNYFLLKK